MSKRTDELVHAWLDGELEPAEADELLAREGRRWRRI